MKKQFVCAIGAAVALGFCGASSAAGQLHVGNGDSSYMPLTTAGVAVSYAFVDNSYVADVTLQGFMFCNHIDTQVTPPIKLVARHGAWTFGSSDPGTVAPVPGITGISYNGQTLNLATDSSTQCFQANRQGQGITDLHHVFASGFDDGEVGYNMPNTSAVIIAIDHIPAPNNTNDTFRYTVTVLIAVPQAMGQTQVQSLPMNDYFLSEGYDANVFSDCNIVNNGEPQSGGVNAWTRACHVRRQVAHPELLLDVSQLNGTVPVVAAALFTGPTANEKDFGDNLAFGYPAVTPPQ